MEEENKNIETNQEQKVNKPKGKKSKVIILLLLVIALVFGAVFLVPKDKNANSKKNDTSNKEEKKEEQDEEDSEEDDDQDEKDNPRYGKEITIYRSKDEQIPDEYYYSNEKEDKSYEKVGKFTCLSKDCVFKEAGKKYALVAENGGYSIYKYTNNHLVITDFVKNAKLDDDGVALMIDPSDNVKGVYATGVNVTKVYNIKANQTYSFKGAKEDGPMADFSSFYYKSLIYLLESKGEDSVARVYNTETGKVILEGADYYSAIGNSKKLVIFASYDKVNKLFDSDGKQLLNNLTDIDNAFVDGDKLIVDRGTHFTEYEFDSLKLIKDSKQYSSILMIRSDFILVTSGTNLKLLDRNENELATFITDYNKDTYFVHTMLSGWYKDDGKNGIYIVVETEKATKEEVLRDNKDITAEELEAYSLGYEYYYIPSTKETGKIATYIGGYAKPILYLYPKEETKVTVTFDKPEMLTTTYPKYINNWTVIAKPNGDLKDQNGRYYYGLYWEEEKNHEINFNEGFYVTKENALKFLEEKLDIIGLTEREANEFIMYWLPILEKNKKSLVYFELTKERDSYSKINISPKPDSMLRLAIHIKKVNDKVNIKEQKLTTFKRTGFSVVEWGGELH